MNIEKVDTTLTIEELMINPFSTAGVEVNVSQNSIVVDGQNSLLQPKVLELLTLLCAAQGETLTKQELIQTLWPDTVVGPDSLANTMARLRKVINDDAKNPTYIQTVQRKGYRWLQPVTLVTKQTNTSVWSRRKVGLTAAICLVVIAVFLTTFSHKQKPVEKFPFPDLSIKKLEGGGYEIQAGIEGELTEEKKKAMLEEIKRITGEQDSGMVFTVDPVKPNCEPIDPNTAANKGISPKCKEQKSSEY